MPITKLDNLYRGQVHGARTTANFFATLEHMVQKKWQPYFHAICQYIATNTTEYVDRGYPDDMRFGFFEPGKNGKLKRCKVVECGGKPCRGTKIVLNELEYPEVFPKSYHEYARHISYLPTPCPP